MTLEEAKRQLDQCLFGYLGNGEVGPRSAEALQLALADYSAAVKERLADIESNLGQTVAVQEKLLLAVNAELKKQLDRNREMGNLCEQVATNAEGQCEIIERLRGELIRLAGSPSRN